MSKSRWTVAKAFVCISFILLLFQSPLSRSELPAPLLSFFGFYDELVAGVFFVALTVRAVKKGIPREYFKDVALFLLFLGVGFVGTALNNIQPMSAVFEDVVACSKFVVALYGAKVLLDRHDALEVLASLERLSYLLIAILFSLTVFDLALPNTLFQAGYDDSLGLRCVRLFYYHPAVLAQVAVILLAVISANPSKRNTGYRVMALAILAATGTGKAFGFVFLYLFICGYGRMKSRTAKAAVALCAILCVMLVGCDSLGEYYGNEASARYTLTSDSLDIARENAPIGLGFATFGSAAAASHYSPIYVGLGYLGHYGLGYVNSTFLTDTFWPALFGEFGYLGTLSFIGFMLFLIKRCLFLFSINRNAGIASLSIIGWELMTVRAEWFEMLFISAGRRADIGIISFTDSPPGTNPVRIVPEPCLGSLCGSPEESQYLSRRW